MLQHFTWQQFLVAALILSLIWYMVVIPLFYRNEFNDLLSGKRKQAGPSGPLPHVWDDEFEDELFGEESLMGKTRLPEGATRVSMEQFSFAPLTTTTAVEDDNKETRLGIVPDVLEELKRIFHIMERDKAGKEDFISLFSLVSAKYPKIRNTPNQQAINDYIRENLPFEISDEELDSLWT
jgi:hypothetical protein